MHKLFPADKKTHNKRGEQNNLLPTHQNLDHETTDYQEHDDTFYINMTYTKN